MDQVLRYFPFYLGTFKEDIKEGNGLIILTNGETI